MDEPSHASETLNRMFHYILKASIENPMPLFFFLTKPYIVNSSPFPAKQAGNGLVRGGHRLLRDVLTASAEVAREGALCQPLPREYVKWYTWTFKHHCKLYPLK